MLTKTAEQNEGAEGAPAPRTELTLCVIPHSAFRIPHYSARFPKKEISS